MSTNRLEAFSDGVFAIAITLLVLEIHVPEPGSGESLGHELLAQWPSYAAFVVSFLTIGIIWINHHAMVRRLRRADHSILIWNLLLLMTVSALPFTTALMATYLKESSGESLAAAVFSGSFLLMGVVFAGMNRHILFERADRPSMQARRQAPPISKPVPVGPDAPAPPGVQRRRTQRCARFADRFGRARGLDPADGSFVRTARVR
jgi:uncharacterized membrane protein